jgi:SAM-dependent methyltransferase
MSEGPKIDEYDWDKYTADYANQMREMQEAGHNGSEWIWKRSMVSPQGPLFLDDFHSNWKEIYHACWELKPRSILEAGCGAGHHLHNISKACPQARITGIDLLQSQIDLGKSRFHLNVDARQMDFCIPGACKKLKKFDLVYSQAVMMHLSRAKALEFVRNMAECSNKWVLMVERDVKNPADEIIETVAKGQFSLKRLNRYIGGPGAYLFTRIKA